MPSEPDSPSVTLPIASEASIKNGFWFVFPVQGATIRFWGSGLTGMERIYVDDQVVSEHRSLGKLSEHRFSVNGDNFTITFTVVSLLRGPLECRLFRSSTLIGALRAVYKLDQSHDQSHDQSQPSFSHDDFLRWIVIILSGLLFGLLISIFQWPLWWSLAIMAAVVFVISLARASKKSLGGFTIEEIPEAPQEPQTKADS